MNYNMFVHLCAFPLLRESLRYAHGSVTFQKKSGNPVSLQV